MRHLKVNLIIKVYKIFFLFFKIIIILENIVLRTLVGDPNRHTPLADHRSTSSILSQEKQDASMYTLQTRYQPIPTKVLPKNSDPRVYYIDSQRTQESPSINERMLFDFLIFKI